ncbi:DUF5615 family PIN-like protein [Paludisphaera rhizosphaerae]|uniref:DUF5615 family PIN-like protein n=1 Tax=Paludisphaera rhizosphaerae TaxID=2711216 RepID=UPI0013EBD3DA|nr:DUF5615 family PIN-like protein [Paludisphaera rhizosphaerae]
MPRTIRFHLDENCDPRIARGLRRHQVDVTTSQEVGLLTALDDDQHAFAKAEGRVIITQDTDFLRIHASGAAHSGIAFYPSQSRSIGEVVRAVLLIWEHLEPHEMANHVEHL